MQVYGIAPCRQHQYMTTTDLARSFLAYTKAPQEKLGVYTKNLALLVSFNYTHAVMWLLLSSIIIFVGYIL